VTARLVTAVAAILWSLPAGAQTASGSIQGQVVDAKTGGPVRFATVWLLGPGSSSMMAPASFIPVGMGTPSHRAETTADEQGRFVFKEVAPGGYVLGSRRDGYAITVYGPTTPTRTLVTVKEGETASGLVIQMPPTGVIAGKVLNEKGEPIQNVELVALRYYYGAWMWRPPVTPETTLKTYSNDLGEFRISDLTAGTYVVRASARRQSGGGKRPDVVYPTVFYPNAQTPEDAQPITVTSGLTTSADFTVRPGAAYRITGTIDSGGSDQPVCFGLAPKSYNSAIAQVIGRVTSFAGNRAFVIDDVPPGSYVLSAAICRGVVPLGAIQPIEVSGDVEGLNIQLSAGQSLSGVVKSPGLDLSHTRLILYSPELLPGFFPRASISDDGAFVFDHVLQRRHIIGFSNLPAGAYVQSVKYGGQEVQATGFAFDPSSSLEITISAQGAAQLNGTVLDKSGSPAPYAMVMAIPSDDGAAESARDVMADEKGNYTFSALRPGSYKVLAWEYRYNPFGVESADPALPTLFAANARTVAVSAGAPATLGLTLNTQEDVNRARAAARMTPPNHP
jgi:hypothetical protein